MKLGDDNEDDEQRATVVQTSSIFIGRHLALFTDRRLTRQAHLPVPAQLRTVVAKQHSYFIAFTVSAVL